MTHNLILGQLPVDAIRNTLQATPMQTLLPPARSGAWKAVAANSAAKPWIEQIATRARGECEIPLPPLTPEMYADFHATGNRLRFERVYFEHRRQLNRAAIATLTAPNPTDEQRFLASMLRKMQTLLDEPTWALPAHVKDKSGIDPMMIDLFAAETANLFGELFNCFGAMIPQATRAAIVQRLTTHIWKNYLAGEFVWYTIANNWNAVCHQGVLGSALAACADASLLADMLAAAGPRLATFLNGFSSDGGCSEGAGYWSYGFGWFCELNRQLELRTDGKLSVFEGDARIKPIAEFGAVMMLENGYTVNFADAGAHGWPRPPLLEYLANRLDNPTLREAAPVVWRRNFSEPLSLDQERADFMYHSRLLLACPQEVPPPRSLPLLDAVYPKLAIALLRFRDDAGHLWEFACKGGHNEEFHNHNDLGAYLLHIDGQPLLTEIGAPEYVKEFFGPGRYTFNAARSLGHPVPLINGQEQAPGRQYESTFTIKRLSADRAEIEIDLTAGYPAAAGARRVLRAITIDKHAGQFEIVDAIEQTADGVAETAMISGERWTLDGNKATVTPENSNAETGNAAKPTLVIQPIAGAAFAELQILPFNDHGGHPDKTFRLVIRPTQGGSAARIGFKAHIVFHNR